MIKVWQSGVDYEDIRRLVHSVNNSEYVEAFPAITTDVVGQPFGVVPVLYGGVAVDRFVFRHRLPDARWLVYAAGFAATSDANTVTLGLYYQKDDTTAVPLGTITHTGGFTKKTLGPFDVFATVGVPGGETVPMIRFGATKNVAGTASLANWNLWLRLLAPRQ